MNRFKRSLECLAVLLLLALAFLLARPGAAKALIPVDSISVTPSSMTITKAFRLEADVRPRDAEQTVTWNSSNPTVATVNQEGLVTPKPDIEGTCTITATATDGSKMKDTCVITVKRFTYTVDVNNEATITWYNAGNTVLSIPAKIDGHPVTAIGNFAFKDRADLTGNLVIPNSVRSIGQLAFTNCFNLSGSLTIPDGVIQVAVSAFSYCTSLTSVTIPMSVTDIGYGAFDGCSGFSGSLVIPDNVTNIGDFAFRGCSGFTGGLVIPGSAGIIGQNAFKGCSGFTGSLVIPDNTTIIGPGAFMNCSGFTGSLTIGNSVESIGNSAFEGCSGFTGGLAIPGSVVSIGNNAFHDCFGFSGSLSLGGSIESIGEWAFANCGFTGSLLIPGSVTDIGEKAFYFCTRFTGSLSLPNNLSSIEHDAFAFCSGLTSLIIPDSVLNIKAMAFYECHRLERVYILSRRYALHDTAFENTLTAFYGYDATPIEAYALASNRAFYPFSIVINGWNIIKTGETSQLITDSVLPPGAVVAWSSSDPAVATVSQSGLVTGKTVGSATITAAWTTIQDDFMIGVNKGDALPGDANNDGAVDIMDLVAIIDFIVSGTPCPSPENANANTSGGIDIMDLVWIIDRIVGG